MTSGVPAVFPDRDGVLIEDTGYPHLEEHLHLIPGAAEAVRRLAAKGAVIAGVYACPFHAEALDERYRHADHPDRKPNPGMILRAVAEHRIDPARSFLIGDQATDLEAARRAGIPGFRFDGGNLDDFVKDLLGH